MTDYVALINRFAGRRRDRRDGLRLFLLGDRPRPTASSDDEVAALTALVPSLALAVKCASLARIAGDPGRDLSRPRRRAARARRPHSAAAWPSGSTRCCGSAICAATPRITDSAPPEEIIPLLNDYAEAVISAIHEHGGDVLKLIGDGTLAIFPADDPGRACRARARRRGGAAPPRRRAQRSGAAATGCRRPTSISACISARCSTAISAARSGSTSPSSGRRSTRSAASPRCAARSTGTCCCRPISPTRCRRRSGRAGLGRPLRAARRRAPARAIYPRPPGAGLSPPRSSDAAAPPRTVPRAPPPPRRPASPRAGCWRCSCAPHRPRPGAGCQVR